ncbi:hypothetical protein BDZ94DRAFT_1326065 [Collybia nuda]|uniref:F-box domain-containing protein n=1 Tax=Collybia nuda TaxID=64659 RepID=A0A9P5XUB6_9AGAR|nr:hypothetical protein BDZ94DRAFT_1326065 [Collybia nuda]
MSDVAKETCSSRIKTSLNFPETTRSNDQLTDAETITARNLVELVKKQLRSFETALLLSISSRSYETGGIQLFTIQLAERARALYQLDRCKFALAPYKKLPVELISYIFTFILPSYATVYQERGSPTYLCLTQICSTWREIAFNTPLVWEVVLPRNEGCDNLIKLTNSWFRQSVRPRFSLIMPYKQLIEPLDWDWRPPRNLIDDIVIPHAHRFQKLSVIISMEAFEALVELPQGSWKSLEVLFLRIHDKAEEHFNHPASSFGLAPLLHEFGADVTSGCHISVYFPWAQITKLYLNGMLDADVHLRTLSHCPLLTDLILTTIFTIDANMESLIAQIPDLPLQFKFLSTIQLHFSCLNPYPFLSALGLPSARSVRIVHPERLDWISPGLIKFLRPMKTSLQQFESTYTHGFPAVVDESIFGYIPSLQALKLSQDYLIPEPILVKIGTGEFLPNLQHIEFNVEKLGPALDMLKVRVARAGLSRESSSCPVVAIRSANIGCSSWGSQDGETIHDLILQDVIVDLAQIG